MTVCATHDTLKSVTRSRPAVAIVNPVCGRGRGTKLRARTLAELGRLFPDLTVRESSHPGAATGLARDCASAELVIAVGGDGTVREVGSGLIGTNTTLAIIPTGSGNDLAKTLGIPSDIREACRIARFGTARRIDAVRLTPLGSSLTPAPQPLVFVNAAGFGFDAAVVAEATKLRALNGTPLYLAAVFRAVRKYDCPRVRIRLEGREWEQRILLLAAANGRIYGGGMKIAPRAEPDDGLLEICVIEAVGRLTIIRRLPRFVTGTHTSLKEVQMFRSSWLELEFLDPFRLQLDGDLQPSGCRCFRLEVLPRSLAVRT